MRLMRRLLTGGTFIFLAANLSHARGEVVADRPNTIVLVELFTSQGCSSCPGADALVRDLPNLGFGHDKVVPLTFHVDYWDELGWKDPFASPEFAERQRWYERSRMLRSPDSSGVTGVYTPQMIVAGKTHFSGQRRETALAEIRRAADRPPRFALTADARLRGHTIYVTVDIARVATPLPDPHDWAIVVALTQKLARTRVAHGENAGETLDEVSVVRAMSDPLVMTAGKRNIVKTSVPLTAGLAPQNIEMVAFVQSRSTLEIAAAVAFEPATVPCCR